MELCGSLLGWSESCDIHAHRGRTWPFSVCLPYQPPWLSAKMRDDASPGVWLLLEIPLLCFHNVSSNLPSIPRQRDSSNSVVAGIPAFCPIVFWLFRGISNPGNGFYILQTKFYGHQQTERCSMVHGEGLTVEVWGQQRLWMAGGRQVAGHKERIRIPRSIERDRGLHTRPSSLRRRWVGAKQVIESQTGPPRDRTPAFDANHPRNLFVDREA